MLPAGPHTGQIMNHRIYGCSCWHSGQTFAVLIKRLMELPIGTPDTDSIILLCW